MHRNRKHFPENMDVTSKINRGECKFLPSDNLTICRWFDNRDVFYLSTCFSDSTTTIRRRVEKELKDVPCGGLQQTHGRCTFDSPGHELLFYLKKWWRRVFWRLNDHAIINACFVQRQLSGYYYASEGFSHGISLFT